MRVIRNGCDKITFLINLDRSLELIAFGSIFYPREIQTDIVFRLKPGPARFPEKAADWKAGSFLFQG